MSKYNLAVAGATGAVGRTILSILHQRNFPINKIYVLASKRSAGSKIAFGDTEVIVEDMESFDFSQAQIALFSAGASVSAVQAVRAAKAGCWVVDNTSHFRYMDHIPLVVSEVNPHHLQRAKDNIIANPNCSTMQMMVALNQIQKNVGIKRINIASYQSVSGSGNKALEELNDQLELRGKSVPYSDWQKSAYPRPIAFNVIPQIDVFMENDYTKEEMKMVWETQKIFDDTSIAVNPTCVRVPVAIGHSLALHIETSEPVETGRVCELLGQQQNLTLLSDREDFPTPLEQGDGTDDVYVGRIRKDISHPNGINMWVVADNLRKGAALNTVQIAELLIKQGMV